MVTITFQSMLKLCAARVTLIASGIQQKVKIEEPAVTTQSPPRSTHHAGSTHEPPEALRVTGILVALAAAVALVAIAFALPATKSKPHDVPIGAVGPPAVTGQVADVLERNAPGAFAVTIYPNEADLRTAIRNRDVYGGLSFAHGGPTLFTATGASPAVAALLTQVGNGVAQQSRAQLRTE